MKTQFMQQHYISLYNQVTEVDSSTHTTVSSVTFMFAVVDI